MPLTSLNRAETSGTSPAQKRLKSKSKVQEINPDARFLHDDRAAMLEETVLWHGGEAAPSRERFMQLDVADRTALVAFLESL